jgi:hypothetical protein
MQILLPLVTGFDRAKGGHNSTASGGTAIVTAKQWHGIARAQAAPTLARSASRKISLNSIT